MYWPQRTNGVPQITPNQWSVRSGRLDHKSHAPDAARSQKIAKPPHSSEKGITSQSSWWKITDGLGRPVHSTDSPGNNSAENIPGGGAGIICEGVTFQPISTFHDSSNI